MRVSRSWESWVNGLLRTQTVADEEVLCAALRNGRAFKLYVNTSCSSPVMKGELLVDGKVISRLVRTYWRDWSSDVCSSDLSGCLKQKKSLR